MYFKPWNRHPYYNYSLDDELPAFQNDLSGWSLEIISLHMCSIQMHVDTDLKLKFLGSNLGFPLHNEIH